MVISKIRAAYQRHQQRQRCLDLSLQILELISHLQQHRGATLAILGGDVFFEHRLRSIKPLILEDLQEVQLVRERFIDDKTWEGICSEWFTVNHHWRQDNALNNFELHTHLLQQLLRLYKELLSQELFVQLEEPQIRLAKFSLAELPELMETAAQIRGIGTHQLATKAPEPQFRDRLGFLSRYFSRTTEHMQAFYDIDDMLGSGEQWHAMQLSWQEISLQLEALAKRDLAETPENRGTPSVLSQSDYFFNASSQLVFHAKQCIKAGLKKLKAMTEADLELWIKTPTASSGTRLQGAPAFAHLQSPVANGHK